MSTKDDRTLLIETHRDVEWIKNNIIDVNKRVEKVEKKVWYGTGCLAGVVFLFELFREKIFR